MKEGHVKILLYMRVCRYYEYNYEKLAAGSYLMLLLLSPLCLQRFFPQFSFFIQSATKHKHSYIHTHTHTRSYTHTYVHTYTHTYIYTHAHIYIRTHTHTHTHTHAHIGIHQPKCNLCTSAVEHFKETMKVWQKASIS